MINGKSVLAIVPARGGSKGVKRKNIRDLAGKPLIAWTIAEAKKSHYIDRLVLSSEDDEIIQVAREWGCEVPFKRPARLAADDTPGIAPVLYVLEMLPGYDYVVLLQPTSPLRTVDDIDKCIEQCLENSAPACVSITQPSKSPFWSYTLDDRHRLTPLIKGELMSNRQSLPVAYTLNGAIYVAQVGWLESSHSFISDETLGFEMSSENSWDIDTELDLALCECIIKSKALSQDGKK